MKLLLAFVFLLTIPSRTCDDLTWVRKYFEKPLTEVQLNQIINLETKPTCKDLVPYIATATMQKAKFTWKPTKKHNYFVKGKLLLEKFITNHPTHVEARYLRWLCQKNTPSFLNYHQNLQEDYRFVLENLKTSQIPQTYQNIMLQNLKQYGN